MIKRIHMWYSTYLACPSFQIQFQILYAALSTTSIPRVIGPTTETPPTLLGVVPIN